MRRLGRVALVAAAFVAAVAAVAAGLILIPTEMPHGRARVLRARVDVQRIATDGVEAFHRARGRYPTTDEGLAILIREGFLRSNAPDGSLVDPWGRPYAYERPGRAHPDGFDVRSYGADGVPGGNGENADFCNE